MYGWKPEWKHKNFVIWGINANVFSQTRETSNKLKLQKENFQFKKNKKAMHSITKKNMLQLKLWQKKKLKKIKFVGFVSICVCLYPCVCVSDTESLNIPTTTNTEEMEKILLDIKLVSDSGFADDQLLWIRCLIQFGGLWCPSVGVFRLQDIVI